jgi:hypothetical protein
MNVTVTLRTMGAYPADGAYSDDGRKRLADQLRDIAADIETRCSGSIFEANNLPNLDRRLSVNWNFSVYDEDRTQDRDRREDAWLSQAVERTRAFYRELHEKMLAGSVFFRGEDA